MSIHHDEVERSIVTTADAFAKRIAHRLWHFFSTSEGERVCVCALACTRECVYALAHMCVCACACVCVCVCVCACACVCVCVKERRKIELTV